MTALDPGTPSTASDAELIAAVRAGDKHAYGELYERHGAAAATVARQYVSRPADADDVVSDSFAKVLSVLQSGGGPDVAFRAYLFTVVRHTAYGMTEGSRRQRPTDDWTMYESAFGLAASTEEPALESFERSVVSRAYRGLPERWQAVLWYTEVESLTPAQIAPLLGLTANGVSALAYRAREGLRQAYLQQHLSGTADEGCHVVNGLLGSYVRGGLAKRETAQVESHLAGCGECRALALELGDVAHGMRGVIAPLVLGTGGLALVGHALPLGGGAGVAGGATVAGGAGSAATGGGAAAGGGAATGGGATAGAGSAGSGAMAASGAGTAGAGGASGAAGGVASGVGAAASGAGATGGAAVVGGAGTASAGATGIAAFFAAAPITATVVTVGLTAAVGVGVAAGLGVFSGGTPPEAAAPLVTAALTEPSLPTPGAEPSSPVVEPTTPDLTSPTTVAPVFPEVTPTTQPTTDPVVPPVVPVADPLPTTAPTADPTTAPVDPPATTAPVDPPPPPTPASLAVGLDGAPTFTVGSATQVSLTASNTGGTAAQDVDLTLQLPQSVDADSASLLPGGTGGSGGGLTSAALRLDVPDGTCVVTPSGADGGPTVVCHVASLAAGAQVGVSVNLTPRSRSFGGIGWQISAEGYTAPWTGSVAPQDSTVHSANLVPSSSSDLTVANPGEGDVRFTLANTGDAGAPSSATVALTVPDGVRVTSLTGGGSWTPVDGFGGTVWRVPAGFALPSGDSTALTAHVVADGTGGASGTAPDGAGRATLTVRGAVADNGTPTASTGLTVEKPWQGADVGTPSLQCTGPESVGAATVAVPVVNGSSAALTAVVTRDAVSGDAGVSGSSGSVGVPVVYAGGGAQGLTVTFQRTVDGVLRVSAPVTTSYRADPCAPDLSAATARSATLANPDTTSTSASVSNGGSVAATGVTATVAAPDGVFVRVGDGWTQTGDSTWTLGGSVAAGDKASLPLTLTTRDGARSGPVQVTFAVGNPGDADATHRTASWSQDLVVEDPWTGASATAAGAVQCTGWEKPGQGTLTIAVANGSVAALTAGAPGAKDVTVGSDGAQLVVPVTYQRHHGWHGRQASVDVTLTRDGQTTTRTVTYVQNRCPGKPVLDAHDGADASVPNPGSVTVTVSVTNDGTATAYRLGADLDLPAGYTVDGVGGDFHGRYGSIVADRSLAPGQTATLRLDLGVDRDAAAGTDRVAVTFGGHGVADATAAVQVATEVRWPVGAAAAAQCDGTVTLTLTNGSAWDVTAVVDGKSVQVPGNGSVDVTVRADRHHGHVRAGSVHVTISRGDFTTSRDASYDAPDCTHPAASVASVGACTFDRGSQQSSAPVAILLDNTASSVDVWFRVSGGRGVLVEAGDSSTVQRTVGEQAAAFTVNAAGETFTLPVDGVRCVPDWQRGFYDEGDRVTYDGDVWRLDHGVLGHHRLSLLAPPAANDWAQSVGLPQPWSREG
ncbi:sigma-70 family RNA polymerase sigma factor [Luteimicrobium sp. DT211]|uniref:sigma-70 family RNA polymerase sigma factor n=1 Tax=Luteimicrobium sp. DT211 TaxID=3393412 RepID=UPI003CEB08A2